jgi:hypothetical protein
MLSCSHSGGYEEFCLLGYKAMQSFEIQPSACYQLRAGLLFGLFVDLEGKNAMFLRNSVYFQRTAGRYVPVDRSLNL